VILKDCACTGLTNSSWLEHQRQHRRVTSADQDVQALLLRFHKGAAPPVVQHLIAARPQPGTLIEN
jgi:hypothetical protein